ncbi:MAG TPA: hypothetical protein VGQ83_08155 [Polyangia bacterium]|jgi:hypothetical protein
MRRLSIVLVVTAVFGCAEQASVKTTCTANEKTCEGAVLRTCAADGSSFTESTCQYGCQGGVCLTCTPAEARCEGATRLVCTPTGNGWAPETCPNGCDGATGTCKSQVCVPNAKQCATSSTLQTCKADGSGYTSAPCDYGCDAATSACKTTAPTCTAGQKQCNSTKLQTCKADATGWDEQLCQYGCDATATPAACKAAACTAGQKRCSTANPKVVQTCNADLTGWVDGTVCPGTCANGDCQAPPTCNPGEEVCRQGVAYHKDEIDKCSATGTWELKHETCTTGSCYDAGGTPKQYACGTCWKNERSCRNEDIMECADPQAGPTLLVTCQGQAICLAGTCSDVVTLGADATTNYQALAQAFVDCWYFNNGTGLTKNEMCYNIDGQYATSDISYSQVERWVCDTATAGDFYYGQQDYDLAGDLFGCSWRFWGFNNSEIFWKWDPLPPGSILEACIWYHPSGSILHDDEDTLDHCDKFWAP